MTRPWDASNWLADVQRWVPSTGRTAESFEFMHKYSWSAMVRVQSSRGVIYFKATSPPMRYEAALTYELTRWRPDVTVELLAHDSAQGLAADG